MSKIGIIANPASGRDIRRLVAHASVFDNLEKAHILRRVLLALDALGIQQVIYMPDYGGLVDKALKGLKLSLKVVPLDMEMWADERDTTEAAKRFCQDKMGCIITLGGDGTNRAVAKGCSRVPIVAISTGTNNVFPSMIEGTVASCPGTSPSNSAISSSVGISLKWNLVSIPSIIPFCRLYLLRSWRLLFAAST